MDKQDRIKDTEFQKKELNKSWKAENREMKQQQIDEDLLRWPRSDRIRLDQTGPGAALKLTPRSRVLGNASSSA